MVKDERRSADGYVSIGEAQFRVAVQLLIRQPRQIVASLPTDFPLEGCRLGDRRTLVRSSIYVREPS